MIASFARRQLMRRTEFSGKALLAIPILSAGTVLKPEKKKCRRL
jgi:hypothetical protein